MSVERLLSPPPSASSECDPLRTVVAVVEARPETIAEDYRKAEQNLADAKALGRRVAEVAAAVGGKA